jgi:hypothetical protein
MKKVGIHLSDAHYAVLEQMARERECTLSQVIREALGRYRYLTRANADGARLLVERVNGDLVELVLSGADAGDGGA